MKKHDAIVIGAGHKGLTNGAYLAKAGLDVLMVEKNEYIGGATASQPRYKDWKYSNLLLCVQPVTPGSLSLA